MGELRHFTFMESWLDDMQDWNQEEKNEALWRIINYGIYRDCDLSDVPLKEQAWYKNVFRVIDKGGVISAGNAVRGIEGGRKNKKHDENAIIEAFKAGCRKGKEVADYVDGEGSNPAWIYKTKVWERRKEIIAELESSGKLLESNGKQKNSKLETVGKVLDSNGKEYVF